MRYIYVEDYLEEKGIKLTNEEKAWLDKHQRYCWDLERYTLLYALCKECDTAIEIGAASGWGSQAMAKADTKVIGIDITTKLKTVHNIRAIRGKSRKVLPTLNPVDLVFIDGGHDYKDVEFDLAWSVKNAKKYMVIHDYNLEKGVTNVVDDYLGKPDTVIMDIKKSHKPITYGTLVYEQ